MPTFECNLLTASSTAREGSQAALVSASPAAHYREHASKIALAWSGIPALSGAAALHAAAATAEAVQAEHKVSLVWTGPATPPCQPALDTFGAQYHRCHGQRESCLGVFRELRRGGTHRGHTLA